MSPDDFPLGGQNTGRVWEEHRVRFKFLRSPELVSGSVLIAHAQQESQRVLSERRPGHVVAIREHE